ncbi:MAG: UvrD-helicase domain-containing protein [Leptospirales bacterium]
MKLKQHMELVDQSERDAILKYHGNQYILAGAGAGKSTILAGKIARLVGEGVVDSITEIVAITFTKKAAGELKWKIEEQIRKLADSQGGLSENPKLSRALTQLSEAPIGTIHSFCADILRAKSLYLKIDPGFRIAAEEESQRLFREFFDNYIRTAWDSDSSSSLQSTWSLILKYDDIETLSAIRDTLAFFDEKFYLLQGVNKSDFFIIDENRLLSATQKLFDAYRMCFLENIKFYDADAEIKDKGPSLGDALVKTQRAITDATTWEEATAAMAGIDPGRFLGGKKYIDSESPFAESTPKILRQFIYSFTAGANAKPKGDPELIPSMPGFEDYGAVTPEALKNEFLRYLWFEATLDFNTYVTEQKRLRGFWFYQDLVYQCYLAVNNSFVLSEVRREVKYIFVDEYQDTDPLQTAIFTTIAETDSVKLFRVGDEKQAIYSFRGADLDTFIREKTTFENDSRGLLSKLSVNMRSHPSIVYYANLLFSSDQLPRLLMPGYETMQPGPKEFKNEIENSSGFGIYLPEITPLLSGSENSGEPHQAEKPEKISTAHYRKAEAQWIASEIDRLLKSETKATHTIALLFPALTNVNIYLEELKALSIPVELFGRKYYGENYPLRYLIHVFRVLITPYNTLSLAALLRSPFFAFTDGDIQKLAKDGFFNQSPGNSCYDNLEYKPPFSDVVSLAKMEKFVTLIIEFKSMYREKPLHTLVRTVYSSLGLFNLAGEFYYQEEITQSLLTALAYCAELDRDPALSNEKKVSELILKLEEMNLLAKESSAEQGKSENNIVQIMSYHKSKGLEFDVVFLPDLIHENHARSERFILESAPPQSSQQTLYQFKNSPIQINDENPLDIVRQRENEEKKRRLYVAITRAKLCLYMPLPPGGEKYTRGWSKPLIEFFSQEHSLDFQASEQFTKYEILDNMQNKIPVYTLAASVVVQTDFDSSEPRILSTLSSKVKKQKSVVARTKDRKKSVSYRFYSGTSLMKLNKYPELGPRRENADESIAPLLESPPTDQIYHKPLIPTKLNDLSAVDRGVLAHSIFEKADLEKAEWETLHSKMIARQMNFPELLDPEIDLYAQELLHTYKSSSLCTVIKQGRIFGKEISFSTLSVSDSPWERPIGVGYIDLLVEDKDENLIIVDYKTNKNPYQQEDEQEDATNKFSQEILNTYLIPMKVYLDAVCDAFPGRTVQAALYHTPSGELFRYGDELAKTILPHIS